MARNDSLWGRMLDQAAATAIRAWMATLRMHIDAPDLSLDPRLGSKGHIFCFWHENLVFLGGMMVHTGTHVLISRSRDGERIARIMQRLGLIPIRGSSSRGGASAALEVLRLGSDANVGIAVDGPRGPRRRLHPGAVFLASRTGMPLVAVGVGYHRAWRAGSWDAMAFAWPWSRAVVSASAPLRVPAELCDDELEQRRIEFETTMHEQTTRAEKLMQQWAASGTRPATPVEPIPEAMRREAA